MTTSHQDTANPRITPVSKNSRARLLQADDTISADIFIVQGEESKDNRGKYLLMPEKPGGKRIRTDHSRILRINEGGSPVFRDELYLAAKCPECGTTVEITIGTDKGECPIHGDFVADWGPIEPGTRPIPPLRASLKLPKKKTQPKKKPVAIKKVVKTDIDFETMYKAGEVWTKNIDTFNHTDINVKSHMFVITTGKLRKLSFNSYNNTWGKKSRDEIIKAFIDDKDIDGKPVGIYLKNTVDIERALMSKNGYTKD